MSDYNMKGIPKPTNLIKESYIDNIYDCPISTQLGGVELMMREEYDRHILRVIQQIGIDIDKEGLLNALNNDRKRYEEAYQKGWNECKKHYDDKLSKIAEVVKDL